MSDSLYAEAGRATFYCPTIARKTGGALVEDMPPHLRDHFDGGGHSAWVFDWPAGARHIEHERNGGVPSCKLCGERLVFVGGDHPGHSQ